MKKTTSGPDHEPWKRHLQSWTLTADERKSLTTLCAKFKEHITPTANPVFARYKFHCRTQGPDECIEDFVTDLRKLSGDCAFTDSSEMISDRIVFGTNSKTIREKLLEKGADLNLDMLEGQQETLSMQNIR